MKTQLKIGFALSLLMASCSKDNEKIPLVADFATEVTGQAPNAQLTITNKSTGENSYLWTFGEGASISTSTDKTPQTITIDKSGDFIITLKVSDGGAFKELSKTITITGNNAIKTYTDIAFAQTRGSNTYGRFFSLTTGLTYKDSEVNSTIGSSIDLAYQGCNCTGIYFDSPNSTNLGLTIPNAKNTLIDNYQCSFTATNFDSMTDDNLLKNFTVVNDGEMIGTINFPVIVAFQNSAGKKGVIKLKAINSDRLLVDIKVQKY